MNYKLFLLDNLNTLNFSMRIVGCLDMVMFCVLFLVCLPLPDILRKNLCSVTVLWHLSRLDNHQGNGSYFYLHGVLRLLCGLHFNQALEEILCLPHRELQGTHG